MENDVTVLPEPQLVFRYGQAVQLPSQGLSVFGPVDRDSGSQPGSVRFGLIGPSAALRKARDFFAAMRGPLISSLDHSIWPPFPGVEATFEVLMTESVKWTTELDPERLSEFSRKGDPHERAFAVVEEYLQPIRAASRRDEKIDVAVCVVPDEIYSNCRPRSSVPVSMRTAPSKSATERRHLAMGQLDLLDKNALTRHSYSPDFRRQLKARAMELGVPVQILRESTLRLSDDNSDPAKRSLTPMSDRAWNLATALYYKAGGKPWSLAGAREGVSYVGLAFRKDGTTSNSRSAVCAAQMFLENGDGIVFKGEFGPWHSGREEFHLSGEAAASLLAGVVETHSALGGPPLKEIFLHSRSDFNNEEWSGYQEACPEGAQLVGIRVRPERQAGLKLYRPGDFPVIRGTVWPLSERRAFFWGSGFTPAVGTYQGGEVPVPLEIEIRRGEADLLEIARDIFNLTKLNFNACKVGMNQPVTIAYSDAVGEILIANPRAKGAQPQFRFYV